MLHNKLVIVSVVYRSPSQSSQEFAQFEMLFSQLLNDITSKRPFFSIILGDFNARSKCWWSLDKQSKEDDSLFLISSCDCNILLMYVCDSCYRKKKSSVL